VIYYLNFASAAYCGMEILAATLVSPF